VLDSTGRAIPTFVPGTTSVDYFPATRGGVTNIDNNSLYVQDHWTISNRWTADLGARYEHVKVVSNPNSILSIDSNRIVPRLATSWDINGNSNHIVHLTYGQYSGRYNEAQIVANSAVGNPPDLNFTYAGPTGEGRGFAPGFDLSNYPQNSAFVFNAPLANTFMALGLKSPLTHEFTVSHGANLWNGRGYAEGTYVWRRTGGLIEDFQTIANGSSHVLVSITDPAAGGPTTDTTTPAFTNRIYENTNLADRKYDALTFQSRYRITNNWSVNGHYTVQINNDGNYEGEGSSTPGSTVFSNSPSIVGNYPEAFNASRNYPDGRLQAFRRHRVRIWAVYAWAWERRGTCRSQGCGGSIRAWHTVAARNQVLSSTQVALMTAAGYRRRPISRPSVRSRATKSSSAIAAPKRSRVTVCSTPRSITTSRCFAR
jgi:hypothetical protein